jgi:hypothetical protein
MIALFKPPTPRTPNLWGRVVEFSETRGGKALQHIFFFHIPTQLVGTLFVMLVLIAEARLQDFAFVPLTLLRCVGIYILFIFIPFHRPLPKELPTLRDVAWVIPMFLTQELIYYTMHRIEHQADFLYDNIHSVHHSHDDEQERWFMEWGATGSPWELLTVQIWLDLTLALMVHPLIAWVFGPLTIMLGYLDHSSGVQNHFSLGGLLVTSPAHLAHHNFHYNGPACNFGARSLIFDHTFETTCTSQYPGL